MSPYVAEFVATLFLVLLGDGVVANVVLNKNKGQGSGWIVITFGWAVAVMIPALMFGPTSGAHMNPAVTLGFAAIGSFPVVDVVPYIIAQLAGAICGGILVWLAYRDHFDATDDAASKLAVFCTAPAIRNMPNNFITEAIATFVLVFALIGIGQTTNGPAGGVGAIAVAAVILSCGVSLGGPTGYAINPARDLGPRIAHFILPIKNKGGSDWSYAWVPVCGPIVGGLIGAILANAIFVKPVVQAAVEAVAK